MTVCKTEWNEYRAMPNRHSDKCSSEACSIYEIRLQGHLTHEWADWFGNQVSIALERDGNTCLNASVVDQAALYGLLRKVRDLGLPLISVICVHPNQPYRK